MPRDLELEKQDLDAMPPLERGTPNSAPADSAPPEDQGSAADSDDGLTDKIQRDMQKRKGLLELKPIRQLLTPDNVDSCVILENAAFDHPEHRCTREKFLYRLSKCPELCMGVFVPALPDSEHARALTWETSKEVGDGTNDHRRLVLVAHAIGTKTVNKTIQDEDMEIPEDIHLSTLPEVKDWTPDSPRLGHKEDGRTVCIHSLGVLPLYQKKGLGQMLLRSYIQNMRDQQVADRVAIITYEDLVQYYIKQGFKDMGPSMATFRGGNWQDMVYDIS